MPSWRASPASDVSKSVCAPVISQSLSPVDASHAWTPPPRVPVTTVPRSAFREYTHASVCSRHRSLPLVASRA